MLESSHVGSPHSVIDGQPVIASSPSGRSGAGDDPRRSIRSMARRWRILLASLILGAILGSASAIVAEDSDSAPIPVDHYQAAHVIVVDSNVPQTQSVLSVRNLNTLAKRITVGEVPIAVAERADLSADAAANQIRVIIRSDSESVDIIAIGTTPAEAERLADLYAEELFAHLNAEAEAYSSEAVASAESRLSEAEENLTQVRVDLERARRNENERRIALLEQDEQQYLSARIFANATLLDVRSDGVPIVPLETLQTAAGTASVISNGRFVELVNSASLGQNVHILFGDEVEAGDSGGALSAVSSRLPSGTFTHIGAGALFGLIAGVMISLFLNRLDNRVRSKRQVEELLDLPVLTEVPTISRQQRERQLISLSSPRSRFAEQYRGLASTIMYVGKKRNSLPDQITTQVVLVTSPGPAEGKTTTVSNLGAMLAEAGQQVLLVNCDFRRPRLHYHLGTDDEPMELHETDIEGVDLITNAIADKDAAPTEVVAAQRRVIEQARGRYDMVVIDTAPLLATNDAVDLLDLVDDVVLVVRAGRTTVQSADRAVEALDRRRAHVVGIAITGVDSSTAEEYYYYGSYYHEGSSPSRGPRGPRGRLNLRRLRRDPDDITLDGPDEEDISLVDDEAMEPATVGALSPNQVGWEPVEVRPDPVRIVDPAVVEFGDGIDGFAAELRVARERVLGLQKPNRSESRLRSLFSRSETGDDHPEAVDS